MKKQDKPYPHRLRLSPAARQRLRGQRLLRQFWGESGDMFFRLDVNTGLYDMVNPAAERIFGWPLAQIKATPFFIFKATHPDDLGWVRAMSIEAMASGELPKELEVVRALRADGAELYVQQKAWAIRDRQGRTTHVEGVVREVTDLVRLRREMEKLLDRLPGLVVRLDERLRLLWANRGCLELLGLSLEQATGRDGPSLMAPGEQAGPLRQLLAGLRPEAGGGGQAELKPAGSDSARLIRWRHAAMPTFAGEMGVLSLGQDVTEHVQAQLDLARAGDKLARVVSLLDRAPVMASRSRWTRGNRLEVEYVNQGCQGLLGYSPEEIRADPDITRRILPDPWYQHYYASSSFPVELV